MSIKKGRDRVFPVLKRGGCGHGLFSFLPGFLRHFGLFGGEKTIYGGEKYLSPVTIAENRNDGAIGLDAVNIHVS